MRPDRLLYALLCMVLANTSAVTVIAEILPRTHRSPEEQRRFEETYDRRGIRHDAAMKTDSSPAMLRLPEDYPFPVDFDIAATPPVIDFAIVQGLEPEYLHSFDSVTGGFYGGWNDVTRGPDGCFYFSIGNHLSYGANARVIRYDPAAKTQRVTLSTKDLIGWGPEDFGDGKLHGDLDIGPGGDMWALTWFGPTPSEEDWRTVYKGGWLIHHNVFTGVSECLGIPLEGETWPYHNYDWQRGVLLGAGHFGAVIVYDTNERRMIYGGACPDGIVWTNRAILLDRETGMFYTSDGRSPHHMVRYERRNNRFTVMNSTVPSNPATGAPSRLRAYTRRKDADGAFWCFSANGAMFRFFPGEDRVEPRGVTWGPEGIYTSGVRFSPKGRYLYYLPGAQTRGFDFGTPLVQYDTQTGRKKVLAFLRDYYLGEYGYGAGGVYGLALDPRGESVFFYVNGRFTERDKGCSYGRPAIFHVHIPASEREE